LTDPQVVAGSLIAFPSPYHYKTQFAESEIHFYVSAFKEKALPQLRKTQSGQLSVVGSPLQKNIKINDNILLLYKI